MNLVAAETRPEEHPPSSRPRGLLARGWAVAKELWSESPPVRFPLLSVGLAIFAVFFLDQTNGILQALIDKSPSDDAIEVALAHVQRWHYWAFVLGLCLWSFVNYESTRLLHQFNYTSLDYGGRLSEHKGWLGGAFRQLERFSPVLAGIGPVVAVALGFRVLHQTYHLAKADLDWHQTFALYAPCTLVALLVILLPLGTRQRAKVHSRALNDRLSKSAARLVWVFFIFVVLLVTATLLAPGIWSIIGPAATLCVIAAVFVALGSILTFWGNRWRLPLVFLTLLYCILVSPWNDNHRVRIRTDVSFPKAYQTFGIRDVLKTWQDRLPLTEPNLKPGQKTPLFIVCAEGGGVRAAYWAARLLAYLEDTTRRYPDQYVPFSSRVLSISGVSGGSLGAVTFAALLDAQVGTHNQNRDWFFKRTASFLGRDQLSAPLASAAFLDTTQRLIPYPLFNEHDRAAGLETAWEQGWNESLKGEEGDPKRFCHFDDDFRDLWRQRDEPAGQTGSRPWLPSLFLNGTSVELGGRIVVSDCVIPTGDYPGAQDGLYLLKLRDRTVHEGTRGIFRISSAINLSTRFPGISPSGELRGDENANPQRVVDGGYYDNSGARTAWDNLVAVYYQRLLEPPENVSDIIPWIIVIRTGPLTKRQTPTFPRHDSPRAKLLPVPIRPTPSHFMVDLLAPPRAFLNASAARSGDSTEALKDGANLISRRLSGQEEHGPKPQSTATAGLPPLERVDYSEKPPDARLSSNPSGLPRPELPHHDPYVIELNLEIDEKAVDPTIAAPGQIEKSLKEQPHKLLLPLGWMLPAQARKVMDDEIQDRLAPKPSVLEATAHDENWFRQLQETQLGRVLSLLHRERPRKPVEPPNPEEPKQPERSKLPEKTSKEPQKSGEASPRGPAEGPPAVCKPTCRKRCPCQIPEQHPRIKQTTSASVRKE